MKKRHFNTLNYTLGNEDSNVERNILQSKKNVYSIAGSGSRVLSLIHDNPAQLTCVDISSEQLALTHLRIILIKSVNLDTYLRFWEYLNYKMGENERMEVFNSLPLLHEYKNILSDIFEREHWQSLLYKGKWELSFIRISKVVRRFLGKKGINIFKSKTFKDQNDYFSSKFPKRRWEIAVFFIGNAYVFNSLMYKGGFPKLNVSKSMFSFYKNRFNKIFKTQLLHENFLMQMIFFGKIKFKNALPIECTKNGFEKIKINLGSTIIKYKNGDILELIYNEKEKIDFVSLSDVPSYFSEENKQKYLQKVHSKMAKDGLIVSRYYLNRINDTESSGYLNITNSYEMVLKNESTQMYEFDIYKKI